MGSAGYEAALDGLEQLRAVLRDEHSLLTQYKMIVWGRVFTPVQVPSCVIVQLCPCHERSLLALHRLGCTHGCGAVASPASCWQSCAAVHL